MLTTTDTVISPTADEVAELQAKHPAAPPEEDLQQLLHALPTPRQPPLNVSEQDVLSAIQSMPPGSSAGHDGLRPLHLLQLTSKKTAEAGHRLLSALTELCRCAISGNIPDLARNAFFGANLVAIRKKDGGIRPIANGSVYRRLVCKLVAGRMTKAVASHLHLKQLVVGTPLACEASVHTVRDNVNRQSSMERTLFKLDLSNAFNSVHRKAVLREASLRFPAATPLIYQAYAHPTPLLHSWQHYLVLQGNPAR